MGTVAWDVEFDSVRTATQLIGFLNGSAQRAWPARDIDLAQTVARVAVWLIAGDVHHEGVQYLRGDLRRR